jgi:hypothetical protein
LASSQSLQGQASFQVDLVANQLSWFLCAASVNSASLRYLSLFQLPLSQPSWRQLTENV